MRSLLLRSAHLPRAQSPFCWGKNQGEGFVREGPVAGEGKSLPLAGRRGSTEGGEGGAGAGPAAHRLPSKVTCHCRSPSSGSRGLDSPEALCGGQSRVEKGAWCAAKKAPQTRCRLSPPWGWQSTTLGELEREPRTLARWRPPSQLLRSIQTRPCAELACFCLSAGPQNRRKHP